jgi:hypothetical protein
MINVFFHVAWGAMGTSAFIFASMLAVLWHHRDALVGVFWTHQAGEPASVGVITGPSRRWLSCWSSP